jgi:hypothetical protein
LTPAGAWRIIVGDSFCSPYGPKQENAMAPQAVSTKPQVAIDSGYNEGRIDQYRAWQ